VTNKVSSVQSPTEGEDYTVTFDANGGDFSVTSAKLLNVGSYAKLYNLTYSGSTASVTLPVGEPLVGYPIYPTKAGYHCLGFASTPDATAPESTIVPTGENTTVYAVYEETNAATPTVIFNANYGYWAGSTVNDINNRVVKKSGDTFSVLDPVRTDSTFVGWSLSNTSNTPVDLSSITTDMTVFAVWSGVPSTYTVTFNLTGGTLSGSTDDKVYTVTTGDTGNVISPVPQKKDYSLIGWAETPNGTNIGATLYIPKSTLADNITYYALWKKNSAGPEIPDDDEPTEEDDTILKSWNIGTPQADKVVAQLYTDGRLVFKGTGDFSTENAGVQWGSSLYKDKVVSVIFEGNLAPTSISGIFQDCSNLTEVDLSGIDFTDCEDMSYAFQNCTSLKSLGMSIYNMNHAKNIAYMFDGCTKLTSVSLPKMNAGSLQNAQNVFSGCRSLQSVDVSNLNTKNATNISKMFYGDELLSDIKTSNRFEIPANAVNNYSTYGEIFQTNLPDKLITTVTGEMTKSFTTYAQQLFAKDNRVLQYDPSAYMNTVTFNYNYPDGTEATTVRYVATGDFVTKPTDPEYDGYAFTGWYYDGNKFDFNTSITMSMELVGRWSQDEVISKTTFVYSFYNGDALMTSVKALGNTTITPPAGPSKTATEEFSHWSLTKGGVAYDFATPITSNQKFYAVMKRRSDIARVVIDYNGGEYKDKTSVSMDVIIGTKLKRPTYKPKQDDYTFKDWYEDPNEGTKFKFNKAITGDTTIYAGWSDKKGDNDDDDKKKKNKDSDTSSTGSGSGPSDISNTDATNLFDGLMDNLSGVPTDETALNTLTVDGVPKTGIDVPIETIHLLVVLFMFIASASGICFLVIRNRNNTVNIDKNKSEE